MEQNNHMNIEVNTIQPFIIQIFQRYVVVTVACMNYSVNYS